MYRDRYVDEVATGAPGISPKHCPGNASPPTANTGNYSSCFLARAQAPAVARSSAEIDWQNQPDIMSAYSD